MPDKAVSIRSMLRERDGISCCNTHQNQGDLSGEWFEVAESGALEIHEH